MINPKLHNYIFIISLLIFISLIGTASAVPSFIYQFSDNNLQLNFTDRSTDSPSSWVWDFGDGYVSTEQNPMHTYATMGNYNVSLTVGGETTNQTVRVFNSSYIIIETTGSTFQPIISVNTTKYPTGNVQWTYQDGTTSNLAAPTLKNFGTAGTRSTALKVTPWDAVETMDFGYNMGDGGAVDIVPLIGSQYVSRIYFINNVQSSLRIFAAENDDENNPANTISSLNFDNFEKLEAVECFRLSTLKSVSLKNIPNVKRLCFEHNGLSEINYTDCPKLEDIRGAGQNNVDKVHYIFGAPLYPNLTHLCVVDNFNHIVNDIPWQKFPALRQQWAWNGYSLTGYFNPSSTCLDGQGVSACSFTSANLYGTLANSNQPGSYGMMLNKLSNVNMFGNPGCIGGSFLQNMLNQTEIDNILCACDLYGTTSGNLNLKKNYYPSATGKEYIENLTAKGWTVTYDDSLNNTSVVQANYSTVAGSTHTNTTAVSLENVKAGHTVVVFIHNWDYTGCTPESVTDDQGHTYIAATIPISFNGGYAYGRWFYYAPTSTADITGITGHFNQGQEPLISVAELRGINNSNPVIFNSTTSDSSTPQITTTEPQFDLVAEYGRTSAYFRQNDMWHTDYFPIQSSNYCPFFYRGCSYNQTWQGSVYEGFSGTYVLGLRVNDTREIPTEAPVTSFTSYSKDAKHYITAFTDKSTNNPTSWLWDFGDGNTSTLQNPTHIYSDSGIYTVTLTTTNEVDSDSYSASTTKRDPELYWYQPYDIDCGSALTSAELSANASVPGTYTYNNSLGTVLNGGSHTLHVDFTPTDSTNYTTASTDVTINIIKGTPEITWSNPTEIIYGTALSSTQLNADAGIPGTYTYNPASGVVMSMGTHNLHVDFVPTDSTNYTNSSKDVTISIVKTTPTLSWSPNPATIPYSKLTSNQLNANSGGVAGTWVYTYDREQITVGSYLPIGSNLLTATFSPTDTFNYTSGGTVQATIDVEISPYQNFLGFINALINQFINYGIHLTEAVFW
jgi:PKD repeat protein